MSEEENKRKTEESALEKIYKKMRKLEDHYYSLKKLAVPAPCRDPPRGSTENASKDDNSEFIDSGKCDFFCWGQGDRTFRGDTILDGKWPELICR